MLLSTRLEFTLASLKSFNGLKPMSTRDSVDNCASQEKTTFIDAKNCLIIFFFFKMTPDRHKI